MAEICQGDLSANIIIGVRIRCTRSSTNIVYNKLNVPELSNTPYSQLNFSFSEVHFWKFPPMSIKFPILSSEWMTKNDRNKG